MSILTGSRERALMLGSVDMERARVMTSCKYDRAEAEMTLNGGAKKQEDQQQVEENDGETQADDPNCDVSSMCIIASLIQSTQHYYSFVSDDTSSATKALSNKMSSKDQTNILQAASTTITTALKKYPARISPRAYRLGHLQAPVRI